MKKLLVIAVLFSSVSLWAHSVTLTWTQSSSTGVTSNAVYRATTSTGPFTKIYNSGAPVTSYVDTTVLGSTTYYYEVTATCNTCSPAESDPSNIVTAVVPPDAQPQPAPPTGLGASSIK